MKEMAIICVDDEEIILNSLGEQLKREFGNSYLIELANSGLEALEICEELRAEEIEIALIISDQNMPRITGDKLLIEIHKLYPQTLKILLTGYANTSLIGKLVNQAALYRYIAKPWDKTDLILTVKEALRCYQQNQKLIQQHQLLLEANHQLEESLSLLVATLEATADGILVLDNCGRVVRCNQKFLKLWDIPEIVTKSANYSRVIDLALEQLVTSYVCNLDDKNLYLNSEEYALLELKNGKFIECYVQLQKLKNFNLTTVWSFRDVTERQAAEKIIKHQAFHDGLTGLANRSLFDRNLDDALKINQKSGSKLAVLFFDLDRFKKINDTLGHGIGDRLLQEVVKRLLTCVREEDTLSRWGGDEFTLLLPKINKLEEAIVIAENLLQVLKSPFNLDGYQLHVTSSIGIAIYPDHGQDSDTLLKNADTALYKAKDKGRNNYQFYHQAWNSQSKKLLRLENRLRYALKRHEFTLYYQPIIDIQAGKITKMETLIRWEHPQIGLVSPGVFIPLAEENGLIIPIGEWVLERACQQNKSWQKMGFSPIKISVNLSPRQFKQSNLVNKVANILQKIELNPSYLELEITETVTVENGRLAQKILSKFKEMGISLAMDDFGTGYSSLNYLKKFPFDTLKIDRSFIQNSLEVPEDRAIIKAILDLGQGLNLSIVAEGIETIESKEFLQSLGCRYMQGYHFSHPLPAEQATNLLYNQNLTLAKITSPGK